MGEVLGTYRGSSIVSFLMTVVPAADSDTDQTQFFEITIRPVLVEHCGKCHSTTVTKADCGWTAETGFLPEVIPAPPSLPVALNRAE